MRSLEGRVAGGTLAICASAALISGGWVAAKLADFVDRSLVYEAKALLGLGSAWMLMSLILAGLGLVRAFRRTATRRVLEAVLMAGAPIAAVYYVVSFIAFYSIDGSFTREGGTTPYCYVHPWNGMYQPLAERALRLGWWGGGPHVAEWLEAKRASVDARPSRPCRASFPCSP